MKGKILDYSIQESKGIISGDDGQRYNFENKEWKSSELPKVNQVVDFEVDEQNALKIYLDNQKSYNSIIEKLKDYYIGNIMLGVILYFSILFIFQKIIDNSSFKDGLGGVDFIALLFSLGGVYLSFIHFNKLINFKYSKVEDNIYPILIIGNLSLIISSIFIIKTIAKHMHYSYKNIFFYYDISDLNIWFALFCLGIVSLSITHSRYALIDAKAPIAKKTAISSSVIALLLIISYFLFKNTTEIDYTIYYLMILVFFLMIYLVSFVWAIGVTIMRKNIIYIASFTINNIFFKLIVSLIPMFIFIITCSIIGVIIFFIVGVVKASSLFSEFSEIINTFGPFIVGSMILICHIIMESLLIKYVQNNRKLFNDKFRINQPKND